MEISDKEWESLKSYVNPVTYNQNNINSVSLSMKQGGIEAFANTQVLDRSSENKISGEEVKQRLEQIQDNESVFIYGSLGEKFRQRITEDIESAIQNTPVKSKLELDECLITEEEIEISITIKHRVINTGETNLYSELARASYLNGDIDDEEDFAYGVVDNCCQIDDESSGENNKWNFDGTLYRFTEEPYDFWSEPDNMEEWLDFVSDSEGSRKSEMERDRYTVHYHPAKFRISNNNPYIKWFRSAIHLAESRFTTSDIVTNKTLKKVSTDKAVTTFTNLVFVRYQR